VAAVQVSICGRFPHQLVIYLSLLVSILTADTLLHSSRGPRRPCESIALLRARLAALACLLVACAWLLSRSGGKNDMGSGQSSSATKSGGGEAGAGWGPPPEKVGAGLLLT